MSKSFNQIVLESKELDDSIERFNKDLKITLTNLVTNVASKQKNYRIRFDIEEANRLNDYHITLKLEIGFAQVDMAYWDLRTLLSKSEEELILLADQAYVTYLNERKGRM